MSGEMEPKVVCAVSSGAYGDYGVMCCFTTRELAQAYCARINEITLDEQKQIDDADAAGSDRPTRMAALPQKLSRILHGYSSAFVEEFELYDFLPGKERNG